MSGCRSHSGQVLLQAPRDQEGDTNLQENPETHSCAFTAGCTWLAGVLECVLELPEATEALEEGWASGSAVIAVRIAS